MSDEKNIVVDEPVVTGPVQISIQGNRDLALQHVHFARKLLGGVRSMNGVNERLASGENGGFYSQSTTLPDGTQIQAITNNGQDILRISSPYPPGTAPPVPEDALYTAEAAPIETSAEPIETSSSAEPPPREEAEVQVPSEEELPQKEETSPKVYYKNEYCVTEGDAQVSREFVGEFVNGAVMNDGSIVVEHHNTHDLSYFGPKTLIYDGDTFELAGQINTANRFDNQGSRFGFADNIASTYSRVIKDLTVNSFPALFQYIGADGSAVELNLIPYTLGYRPNVGDHHVAECMNYTNTEGAFVVNGDDASNPAITVVDSVTNETLYTVSGLFFLCFMSNNERLVALGQSTSGPVTNWVAVYSRTGELESTNPKPPGADVSGAVVNCVISQNDGTLWAECISAGVVGATNVVSQLSGSGWVEKTDAVPTAVSSTSRHGYPALAHDPESDAIVVANGDNSGFWIYNATDCMGVDIPDFFYPTPNAPAGTVWIGNVYDGQIVAVYSVQTSAILTPLYAMYTVVKYTIGDLRQTKVSEYYQSDPDGGNQIPISEGEYLAHIGE